MDYEKVFRDVPKEYRDLYIAAARLYEHLDQSFIPRDVRALPLDELVSDIALMTSALIHDNEVGRKENAFLVQVTACLEHEVEKLTIDLSHERLNFHRLSQTLKRYKKPSQ